ncbi:uncharacterized protein LOC106661015 [Cimex lectularius]|uniref:Uncharacterized protein n=1 Tax=Cimex lectularius TaxID=79782 RepID=A0A8I6TB38_CIMLE|nr:uncharacterized protein LOC106661015 [Cimex lectularius]
MALASLKALGESIARNLNHTAESVLQKCELIVLGQEGNMVVNVPGISMLKDSFLLVSDDCKKLESKMKRSGPICKAADLRPKVLPPYTYGYCKEKEPEPLMSCPPKIKKRGRGPCCHNDVKQTKGGCRNN